MMHTRHIQQMHDETLYFLYTSACSSTRHNTNRKPITQPLHKHTTYFNTPRLKKTLSLTTAATQQTFPQTSTQSLQQT